MSDATAETRPLRPTLAVATIGHHRHGKTTLTSAITHVLARRSQGVARPVSVTQLDRDRRWYGWHGDPHGDPREGELETRTVRAGEVRYATEHRDFVHIDSPGWRPWLKNAARAQALVDALILVVSATSGVEAQTHEHLLLARALGLRQLVVFVNQCDRVSDMDWLDLVEHDTRVLLNRCGFDGDSTRIVRGAALPVCRGEEAWEASIRDLIEALEIEVAPPEQAHEGPPLVYVDHVYSGRPGLGGVLVDGRLKRGEIRRGHQLALVGFARTTVVTVADLEIDRRKVSVASAGDFAGMLLTRPGAALVRHEVRPGQALVPSGTPSVQQISAQIELLATDEGGRRTPVRDGHVGLLLFGTTVVGGRLRLGGLVEPGARATAQVELLAPVHVEPGTPFLFRDGNQGPTLPKGQPARWAGTAGMGRVLAVGPVTS